MSVNGKDRGGALWRNNYLSKIWKLGNTVLLTTFLFFLIISISGCPSKPLVQDLSPGEGTVQIKYLDGMTTDMLDEIRIKQSKFYESALLNQSTKYSQGTQGAIDRIATFAAAISANAQRDKSVLERYHTDSKRQISALENSEELGNAILEHEQEYLKQLNSFNEVRADSINTINKAQAEAIVLLLEEYQTGLKTIPEEITAS